MHNRIEWSRRNNINLITRINLYSRAEEKQRNSLIENDNE